MLPEIGLPNFDNRRISQPTPNIQTMNNRRLLIAAVFHFVHPVEKGSQKHHKLAQNSVSLAVKVNNFQDAA